MFEKIYYWLHRRISNPRERGEYSSGLWQDLVRKNTLALCIDKKENFLEVGCGEGLFLQQLAEKCPNLSLFGVDPWNEILERARKKNIKNTRFYVASAQAMPFEQNFFDGVACINVFFNLPYDKDVISSLKEISRVSKKGAKIIFDIRNSLNPLLFLKYKFAKYYDKTVKDLPLRTYSLKKMTGYLNECGMEITKKIYLGFPYNIFSPIIIMEARKR
ncbi:MAG: class I SAM-dependent methyltransferase [Candidatus Omnitrophica bacterium]|nr:class I SAM-dependent methyltransferase [Candidatus Omnitrophota bacterium]MDD5236287.1 class I SAM-dependent methyltransferase [Candidatus Omnitrophota bacterium]MDD5610523.1 class I SAM-dependent methyltransferase [Candidatus Omnitrophota bacterium]